MKAAAEIFNKYGPPNDNYQAKYCEMWNVVKDFPELKDVDNSATPDPNDDLVRMFINKDFKTKLFNAFIALRKAGLLGEIKTYNGVYNPRSVRGYNTTSLHAWAAAIDLNSETEKLAQTKTNWSAQFLQIMRDAGLYCGADWPGRKDSMHFALYNG